ncbi:hypothetical protein BN1723_013400 [Verticillium longisporum]|uniref:Uncharacterized protein n=1 Tax=Verticillium longisporum TaxID=100787 RepID=A0A0G4LS16_VERLO|nr:hypothetical protein BN1723_013400 [Verticillium longisporum]
MTDLSALARDVVNSSAEEILKVAADDLEVEQERVVAEHAHLLAELIREELGMDIRAEQLTCLSALAAELDAEEQTRQPGPEQAQHHRGDRDENLPRAMYPSAGGCDEHITIYSHERRVPRAQLEAWSGKLTGLRDEGEKITLKLVPFAQLWRAGARDAKCLAALALYEGLKREGRL